MTGGQTIKKVLNSSVVLVEDAHGVERVLLGKGIGYAHRPGDPVRDDAGDRVFVALDDTDLRNFVELLSRIPVRFVELARGIVASAEAAGLQLDPHIYLTLTDHLHFAVERHGRGQVLVNRLTWEVRTVYPREYEIAVDALGTVRAALGLDLPEDEATNIAFHLVNASTAHPDVDSMQVAQLIKSISTIVTNSIGVSLHRDNLLGARFAAHLQFFAERLLGGTLLSGDDFLYRSLQARQPRAISAAERIREFVLTRHNIRIPDEEVAYLALHIARASPPQ